MKNKKNVFVQNLGGANVYCAIRALNHTKLHYQSIELNVFFRFAVCRRYRRGLQKLWSPP